MSRNKKSDPLEGEKPVASSLPGEVPEKSPAVEQVSPSPPALDTPGPAQTTEPQGPSLEDRLAAVESVLSSNVVPALVKLPSDLEASFQAYDKGLMERMAKKGGGGLGDLFATLLSNPGIGSLLGGGGGTDPFTEQITNMTKEIVSISLRGALTNMRKQMGIADHVSVEHG